MKRKKYREKTTSRRKRKPSAAKISFVSVLCALLAAIVSIALNGVAYRVNELPTARSIMRKLGFMQFTRVESVEGDVLVHFIDVGQGDCILIDTGEKTVLIDCGDVGSEGTILSYLESCGIRKLDYLVATHPHADHIGGMAAVASALSVGEIVFPPLSDSKIPTSSVYSALLDVIEEKNIPAYDAQYGENIRIGQGTYLNILAPLHDDFDNLNDFSLVIQLVHGANKFLFTGDIERASENDLLNYYDDLNANVLKVAHHGSTSSSMQTFIDAVSPEYAVISVGAGNSYGHPRKEVLQRLEKVGAQVLRTDELGTIVFVSDGSALTLHTEKYGQEAA